jgi:dinuclear metal center YbgI/SA1388 family protein
MKRRRLQRLLQADVSLLAYHLPLDAHPELGNNAQLASRLGLQVLGGFAGEAGVDIAIHGTLPEPMHAQQLQQRLAEILARTPMHLSAGDDRPICTVGLCSGAAQGYLEEAAGLGLDAYITGEVSEQTVHIVRELGIHFFAAGHHATERYGVEALVRHVAEHFQLEFDFIDIDNPV